MFNYKTGEGEADSEKYRKKRKNWTAFIIGAWALLILTAYQHWCRSENNYEYLSVTWLETLLRPVFGRQRVPPHVASKIPTAFIWPKAPARESVDMHLLWDSGFRSVLLNSGLESNSVPWLLYSGCEDTQASFYLSFFFFFPFFITSSTIALKLVGRQKPSRLHLTGSETNFRIVAKVTGEQIWSHLD